jgi:uncharacterized protein (TIGR02996 family)
MGLWDRVRRVFRPATVEVVPEPEPVPQPARVISPLATRNPPLQRPIGMRPGEPRPPPPVVRNLELEAEIARAHDIEAYLVYADWLLERGDVRGELIVLHHRLLDVTDPEQRSAIDLRARRLRAAHPAHLLGPTIAHALGPCQEELMLGFVHAVRSGLGVEDEARWIAWLAAEDHPATRFLTVVRGVSDVDRAKAVMAAAGRRVVIE